MTISSLRRHIIPAVAWSPDSQEFERGILDQIANVIPVFGSHRGQQKLLPISTCPAPDNQRRVTGTFVHRISSDQSLDIMQPDFAESSPPFGPIKFGFQVVPPGLLQEDPPGSNQGWNQFYIALRGISQDTGTTILLVPQGHVVSLWGAFSRPRTTWDAVNPVLIEYLYRINPGFIGNYDFTIEFGRMVPNGSQTPADFVLLASDHMTGVIAADASIDYKFKSFSVANALLPVNPHLERYAWRILHNMATTATEDEFFNPTEVWGPLVGLALTWVNQANSALATAILPSILGVVGGVYSPNNATYAQSIKLWSNANVTAILSFRVELPQFVNLQGHKITFRWSVTGSTSQRVQLLMYEGGPEDPQRKLIQVWGDLVNNITAGALNTPTDFPITDVNPVLIQQINNWENVWFDFVAGKPTTTSLVTTVLRPIDSGFTAQAPPWTVIGGPYASAVLRDQSDASFIRSAPNPIPGSPFITVSIRETVTPLNIPRELISEVVVVGRMRTVGAGFTRWIMGLECHPPGGAEQIWYSRLQGIFYTNTPGGPLVDFTFTLSAQGIQTLTDWNNLIVGVGIMGDSVGQLEIAELHVDVKTAVGSEVRLHGFAYTGPGQGADDIGAPVDISWMRAVGPASTPTVAADTLLGYIGTVEVPTSPTQVGRIYEIASPNFTNWQDVSKPGGYFSNKRDKSWSFCNFGELVIATNYANPVQVKGPLDTDFRDLIGFDSAGVAYPNYDDPVLVGGVKPRARFAAPISGFLCLANIDPISVPGIATPYTFWCSAAGDPTNFRKLSIELQSSAFPIVATPGEITGLTGGEYGMLYKENSIWRVNYVQLPQVFDFKQVSSQQGTVQPRSIVRVDDDEYFVGIGGIYVVRGGVKLEPLIDGIHVRKWLFDTKFEEYAISAFLSHRENENTSRVIGAYDAVSGCIYWAYLSQMASTDFFRCDCILVYSPAEGKFSMLHGDMTNNYDGVNLPGAKDYFPVNDLRINGMLWLGNRNVSSESHLTKTILPIQGIPPTISQFSSPFVYEAFFRSGTVPSSTFPGVKVGDEIILHSVRPIFVLEKGKTPPPFRIWIEASQSPAMEIAQVPGPVPAPFPVGTVNTNVVRKIDCDPRFASTDTRRPDGWIDFDPLSGEWFKFVIVFGESTSPVIKEFMGWQLIWELAGDH